MPLPYEELDHAETPIGEISLRRRWDAVTERSVLEVKLGDDYLMSSQLTVTEVELARRGMAAVPSRTGEAAGLSVMVGGLGLGFTAVEALADDRVTDLVVVELLAPVIGWHRDGLVAETAGLADDPRCRLVQDDFFDLVRTGRWPTQVDALLVDIDHSPDLVLDPGNADLYSPSGLRAVADLVAPDGVFALWSDDPPDPALVTRLAEVFAHARADEVSFDNAVTGGTSACTVYVAQAPRATVSRR